MACCWKSEGHSQQIKQTKINVESYAKVEFLRKQKIKILNSTHQELISQMISKPTGLFSVGRCCEGLWTSVSRSIYWISSPSTSGKYT